MKKGLCILLIGLSVLFLTGCEKPSLLSKDSGTLTCSKSETDEDNNLTEDTVIVTYKNNKVVKTENTSIVSYEDSSMIDLVYGFGKLFIEAFNNIDGITTEYSKLDNSKIKTSMIIEYDKLDTKKIEELAKSFNSDDNSNDNTSLYNAKDLTLDNYKEEYLKEYTCK